MIFLGLVLLLGALPGPIFAADSVRQSLELKVDLGYAIYEGAFNASTGLSTWKGSVAAFLVSLFTLSIDR